ncbi:hypothetical protein Mal52_18770 [Symmachiella dynata]|uniref:Uncharacterized protein n=1 Tax=Symmachiella dynata TaxID=2527995 RepID=A0A517ZLT4_9PLAN|nr:hypothetical protein [Symmachiella dynata]QDU43403.1 hypothetical protein Mal52_18770 [Symmachiella dynata]
MSRAIWGLLWITAVSCAVEARGEEKSTPAPAAAAEEQSEKQDKARKELLTGQVKFLGPALRARGVKAYDEMDEQVVLIAENGDLVPLVADWRGRAFYQDERLRDRKVQLIVRRRPDNPYAQVLIVYTFDDKGERKYTDYWCDICSIPMYEIKECECCQGPIRLRFEDRPLPSYLRKEISRDSQRQSKSETDSATPDADDDDGK